MTIADCADIVIVPTSSVNCPPGKRIRVCRSAQLWTVAERQEGVGWQVAAGRCAEDVHGASDRPRVEFAYIRGDPRHRADRRAPAPGDAKSSTARPTIRSRRPTWPDTRLRAIAYLPERLNPLGARVETALHERLTEAPSFVTFEGYDTPCSPTCCVVTAQTGRALPKPGRA
jgi:hypothetical protein